MISAINRKLLRDLWQMRGQALAIALVIVGGVATWLIALTTIDSLEASKRIFYQDYRFAEVFASLKRAPEPVRGRLAEIPGVVRAESRVVTPATVDIHGFDEPVEGLITSLPEDGQPQLNRLFLRAGALPPADSRDEVVVAEPFAEAHGLEPGDGFAAIIKGRRVELRVSGVALSPEYVYQIRPGSLFPDHKRYAILWMRRPALEQAADMEGAFNNAVLALAYDAVPERVVDRVDDILRPWGGTGAITRADQTSHNYLSQEMEQLRSMARIVPVIFLAVAAFLLNVVVTRVVHQQREQIAILKAFGYTHAAIGRHYLAMILLVVALGAVPGILAGGWLGHGLAELYRDFFRFPELYYRMAPSIVSSGVLVAVAAAALGTFNALRHAFALPPAEAMRPEPPRRYRRTLVERLGLTRWLDQPTRMILRHLERQPWKLALAVLGIAMAVAILVVGRFQEDTIDHMLSVQFGYAAREDVTVTFTEATSRDAWHELAALPGVTESEPFRTVPVELVAGHREYRTAIQGYEPGANLHRVLDADLEPLRLPRRGVLLTDWLAAELGVEVGDEITVRVLEGGQPVRSTTVVGLAEEYVGVSAYMSLGGVNRLMREEGAISGVFLAVSEPALPAVYDALRERPGVAGSNLRRAAIDSFRDTMGESLIIFSLINTLLAGVIAFGVVYNTTWLALAERERELASLRVLGFTRAEIAYILLGELTVTTLLAMPLGLWIGRWLCDLISTSMASEFYRIPAVIHADAYGFAALVVLVAAVISALLIGRRLYHLDLVGVLKTRE